MSIAQVEHAISQSMDTFNEFGDWLRGRKNAIRSSLVDPILWALGWNTWAPWECLPDFGPVKRRPVDYVLLDPNGRYAVLVKVNAKPARRWSDRDQFQRSLRGITTGIGILTYGSEWEIYNLGLRMRKFEDKQIERLLLDPERPDDYAHAAVTLHSWMSKSLWWGANHQTRIQPHDRSATVGARQRHDG